MKKIILILAIAFIGSPAFASADNTFPNSVSTETTVDLSIEDIDFLTSCAPSDWACNQARQATISIIRQILAELLLELQALQEAKAAGISEFDFDDLEQDVDLIYSIDSNLELRGRNIDPRADLIWDLYQDISPDYLIEDYIDSLRIYFDEDDRFSAYVQLDGNTYPKWLLAINLAQVELESIQDKFNLEETLIHEFAHILTLNEEQTNAAVTRERDCRNYFADEGCYLSNSLMNEFYQEFWTEEDFLDHIQDVDRADEDWDEVDEIVTNFYRDYKDYFVTGYAATNPEEDLAETFTEFIIDNRPEDNDRVRDSKVLFFYEYDDLVDLRTDIRANLNY